MIIIWIIYGILAILYMVAALVNFNKISAQLRIFARIIYLVILVICTALWPVSLIADLIVEFRK